jgi:hypothetical protein
MTALTGDACGPTDRGICNRWPQSGQFSFCPAMFAGDASGFLQREHR